MIDYLDFPSLKTIQLGESSFQYSTKTRIQSSFHNHSFYVDLPHLQSITLGNDSLSGCIDPLNCPCSEAVTTTELIMQSIFLFISNYSNRFTSINSDIFRWW